MAEQYLPGQQFTIQTYSQEQLSLAERVHAPACVCVAEVDELA